MPSKKSSRLERDYEIDGRHLVWHPEVFEGDDPLPDIRIPLRIKLGLIYDVDMERLDSKVMVQVLERIIPKQEAVLREMDINDFQEMFLTWQSEYNTLTGAKLGESSGSPS